MVTNLDYINQICIDLGGVGGHFTNLSGENEICTLLGGTGGHFREIDALNEICTIQSVTDGHSSNLSALNAIAGVTKISNFEAWKYVQEGATLNLCTEYKAILAATTGTKPSNAIQVAQNEFIKGLVDTGRLAKFACIIPYFWGMPTAADALIWANDPTRKGVLHGGVNPAYVVGQGFTGSIANTSYIDETFNPSVDGGTKFTQNDCTILHFFYNNRVAANQGISGINSSGRVGIGPRYDATKLYYATQSAFLAKNHNSLGTNFLYSQVRANATQMQLYTNNLTTGLDASNSGVLQNATTFSLAANAGSGTPDASTYMSDTIALVAYASSFTADDIAYMVTAIDTLMLRIQAATIVMSDLFAGTSIDLAKWDITNGNTASVTFEQNEELILNSLGVLSGPFTNFIASDLSQQWGVFKFNAYKVIPVGYSSVAADSFGITDDSHANRIEIYQKNNTQYLTFRIVINNAEVYEVTNITPDFGQYKIIVSPMGNISLFMWVNDAWSQVGVTQNFKTTANYASSPFKLFMQSRGAFACKMGMTEAYMTKNNYTTLNPA